MFGRNLDINRRSFFRSAAVPALCVVVGCREAEAAASLSRREAQFYEKLPNKKIRCTLCPRGCVIDDRERGYCGVRENRDGTYYTLVHSRPCSVHIDPVEKKPLFHFYPGTLAFSLATAGCNVNCKFCQNWEISQVRPEQVRNAEMSPDQVATLARDNRCVSIAYTYSEPVVFYEYVYDTALAGNALGIKSVVITNGYIQQEPLKKLCAQVEGIKVDLKAFSDKFYREVVNGELKPVLESLVTIHRQKTWLEIVYLVIPTLNDSDQEFRGLCQWMRRELGLDVPVHFTSFHPQYLLKNLPPTPLATLERAKRIADAEGLNYVYIGNVPGHPAESTYCPRCKEVVIQRTGFRVEKMNLKKGSCAQCGTAIAGRWKS
ncbi:MAG: AmmeMemoRadiSam system radical SAM enzyme [Acidobacteria bacterium]|nr:MAG: AmmeMemoRadiSam system radical SAM enzyme [Acidobacteriota bacterium]